MIVKELYLRNFRNYQDERVVFDPSLNILHGENAVGKTNLLEALVYLSMTRSHRVSDEKKLIRNGMPFANIACVYSDETGDHRIEAIIHSKGKTLLVNRNVVKKSSSFLGLLNVVVFSPDDLSIFVDAPKERRKLLDQEITKISKKYLHSLSQYQSLLKERNALLKKQKIDEALLSILDERIIQEEVVIIECRRAFEACMNPYIQKYFLHLYGEDLNACISYECMSQSANEYLYQDLKRLYEESRSKDIENRFTSIGIHREDLIFKLNNENVIYGSSQGQKRMIMLAFKMALLHFIEEASNKKAILLLDDVLSELDETRQRKLMNLCGKNYQCVITTTNIPHYVQHTLSQEYLVRNGHIENAGGKR